MASKRQKMATSRTGTRPFNISRENFLGTETSLKIDISRTVREPLRRTAVYAFQAPKRPKIITSRTGAWPFHFSVGSISGAETFKIDILQTVSRRLRRRAEYAFSGSETSKNCHFPNGRAALNFSVRQFLGAETLLKLTF